VVEFNNELEKLLRTQKVQDLVQLIQGITAIAALYPDIVHAIDWFELLTALNDNLDVNAKIMVTAQAFKQIISDAAQARAQQQKIESAAALAGAAKDGASAQQSNAQAGAIRNGQSQAAGIPAIG
jgi:hypothetical protein